MEIKHNQTPPSGGDRFDVVVNGGGMVGLCMGLALAKEGMRVAVIERSNLETLLDEPYDKRVSAVSLGSKRILDNIGAWEFMDVHAEPILDIRVSDGAAPFFLHYDHREVGDEPFGYIVPNRYIRYGSWLAARLYEEHLVLMHNSSMIDYRVEGQMVHIETDKGPLTARLLIGAEGRKSFVREKAGIGVTGWSYNQTAIVGTIAHSLPHNGLAQERFLPAGPFAVLPMTFNWSSLVWVEPNDRVSLYMELPPGELIQEIRERVGDYLGDIELVGGCSTYPLSLMHADRYTADRVAIIGDAAHGMHPIAGQGVNVGFRDVAVLHELLTERFKLGLDIADPETLAHYARWRRFDNVTMLAATDMLNRLFSNDIGPVRLARGLGLWAVGKMPPLKRFFMRHAMGLVGDLPRLNAKK